MRACTGHFQADVLMPLRESSAGLLLISRIPVCHLNSRCFPRRTRPLLHPDLNLPLSQSISGTYFIIFHASANDVAISVFVIVRLSASWCHPLPSQPHLRSVLPLQGHMRP